MVADPDFKVPTCTILDLSLLTYRFTNDTPAKRLMTGLFLTAKQLPVSHRQGCVCEPPLVVLGNL